MRVFISHAGERSRAVAHELHKFIRKLVPSADPWISTGIEKGSRWAPEIAEQLERAGVGIVCLTSDNLLEPWLLFEAGALSKRLDGKVCTFLLDVEAATVKAPLSQFQHTTGSREDVLSLILTINRHVEAVGEQPRNAEDLEEQFETLWPGLQDVFETFRTRKPHQPPPRTTDDMVKELLELVRGMARTGDKRDMFEDLFVEDEPPEPTGAPAALGDLVSHPQFGLGRVRDVKRWPATPTSDPDFRVVVEFDDHGKKTLRWKYARMEKVLGRPTD